MVRNGNPLAYTGNILSNSLRSGDRALDRTGEATLVAGVATVPAIYLRSNMQIFLSKKTQAGAGAGVLTVTDRTDGTSFEISSLAAAATAVAADVSVINYVITTPEQR